MDCLYKNAVSIFAQRQWNVRVLSNISNYSFHRKEFTLSWEAAGMVTSKMVPNNFKRLDRNAFSL